VKTTGPVPRVPLAEWIIWAPRLPRLQGQAEVSTKLDPGGKAVEEQSVLRRPFTVAHVPVRGRAQQLGMSVQVTYWATLMSRRLVPLAEGEKPPTLAPLPASERKLALIPTSLLDFRSPDFQKWMDEQGLRRKRGEEDLHFARRVFMVLRRTFTYEFNPAMDRRCSVVCRQGKSDCRGLSLLFVAVLRANGVPSRVLVGRWAKSAEQGQRFAGANYHQEHTMAECYAQGIGWVPADVAAGLAAEASALGSETFGNDPGQFLVLHVDHGLVFGPLLHLEVLQGVFVVGDRPHDPASAHQDRQVREVP
jgi:transglutaminase-like putative cysteine protease